MNGEERESRSSNKKYTQNPFNLLSCCFHSIVLLISIIFQIAQILDTMSDGRSGVKIKNENNEERALEKKMEIRNDTQRDIN